MFRKRTARRDRAGRILFALCGILIAAAVLTGVLLFRNLITELAVSTAQDEVVLTINQIVKELMMTEPYADGNLVVLEKNQLGEVTAVTTDVAAVNTLAAEVLEQAVQKTEDHVISVSVPVGNLFGGTLFMTKGPRIPVDVIVLSSSSADFRSEMTTAGINQTRHRLLLDLTVQVSLLMPWHTIGTAVDTEILVSETILVGQVPDSYLNWENR